MQYVENSRAFAMGNNWGIEVFKSYGFKFPYAWTQPIYPVMSVLFYAFTVFYFSPEDQPKKSKSARKKSQGLTPTKLFVFIHNLLLCAFSWIVFINVFPEIYNKLMHSDNTLYENWKLFSCSPMSDNEMYWSYLFYLSKIWEFIDTWIILYKGRKPSTLQTYHHMGAVFACWLQVIVGGKSFWIFVCLNSFIHTIMYAYYCCTTLGYRFKFKFIITILQLSQFIIGQSLGYFQYFNFSNCYRINDFWVWFINTIYVWPLVALFAHFYTQTYLKKKQKKI
eukprot:95838_1